LGDRVALADTLLKTAPLLLAGLGTAIAFRAGMLNIGAEGQIYLGAIAATLFVSILPDGTPGPLLIVAGILAAACGGGAWAGIAGVLRSRRGVNEVVSTLLLNFVAVYLAGLLVNGPLKDPGGSGYPQSAAIPSSAELPILLPGTSLHIGLAIGVVVAIIMQFVLWDSKWGFEIRAVGLGSATARVVGMPVTGLMVSAIVVSGALAGLAGAGEVLGFQHRLFESVSPGYGYTAIVVALLARLNPLAIIATAFFCGALLTGGNEMQRAVGAPAGLVLVIQACAILLLVIRPTGTSPGLRRFRRRLLPRSLRPAEDADRPAVRPAGTQG
jgi:simple sugar transport system permease protein